MLPFRVRDRGARRFQKLLFNLGSYELSVGINKQAGAQKHPNGDGKTVAQVAQIHELGLLEPDVPKRSFLRGWFDKNRSAIAAQVRAAGRTAFVRRTSQAKQAEVLGRQFVRQIQAGIDAKIPPGNAPSTILRKGFDHPLVETRTLHDSISAEVRRVRR